MDAFFCGAKRNDCFSVLCGEGTSEPLGDMSQPGNNSSVGTANGHAPPRQEGDAFLVRVIQDWNKGDVNTSSHCIDIHEGELIVVIRKGSHGWYFGRVLHDAKGWPTEFGTQGWFPPSFTREVAPSENQTKIGAEILHNSRRASFPGK
mmetsp:Transcript_34645/g.69301  ORF Transcript_34645/g.69301 Transcript_34645/m.69301 type:complete len:148 (+) Transcript_34645:90-533(+)